MRDRLILTIPEHIAALPEEEQGPALVNEIHRRKELSNAWEYYASIPVDYDPFKATRAVLGIDPAGEGAVLFHVGGRGHGKTARLQAWLEQSRTQMQNMETMTRQMWECLPWHDPHQEVRDLVRKSGTTPAPSVIPEVASARWVCKAPTAPVYAEGTYGWMMEQMESRISPAMREYNRKLNAENAALYARVADQLGVRAHDTDRKEVP